MALGLSVAGFDIGNDTSCIAIARKRGIDVLMNKESKRETPAVVNFGEKMRFLGTDGSAKQGLAPQNTVHQLKRLLGKKFADPAVQTDIAKLPYAVTEGPDGGCLIGVQYQNEHVTFTPEQVMAMVLVDLKKIAEVETGTAPVDCVLTVPVFYTEAQRYAMLNAGQIAGLNCLRLMNENTATALAYGIFKTDLPEKDPVHVAFVDVGHSATQVSIVSLLKGGLQVRCHTWDSNLGGRDLDELLFNHFAAEFKAKHKIDIPSNKKASFKLRTQVEKVKKMLSANAEAPLNIECIMEDVDVRGMMTRDAFEALAEPACIRFKAVLEKALAQAALPAELLSSVEVVGSSTRVPMLARIVESVFGKAPSRTLNAKECVSRGAALQCAMLSPVFKVRDFVVEDVAPYPIDFVWDKDGKPMKQRVFEKDSLFPSTKSINFTRAAPFSITGLNAETGETIGTFQVGPFTVPAGADHALLKVRVKMDLNGLVRMENVQLIEEEVVAPAATTTTADTEMADAAAGPQPAAANGGADADHTGAAPMDAEAPAPSAGPKPAEDAKLKKKTRKVDVPFAASNVAGYTQPQLDLYFEKEGQMQAADKLQEETADRKNAVETYVYKIRNGLHGPLEPFASPAEKESLLSALQACEDWLYEDGEDVTKSVYVSKLEEMKGLCGPVEARASEAEHRPAAVSSLRSLAEGYVTWAHSTDSRYAHITAEERSPIAAEANNVLRWLSEKEGLQKALSKSDPPILTAADCKKKEQMLERMASPVVNKPVPKPPAPSPTPPPAEEVPTPMESEAGPEGAAPGPEADAATADGATPMNV